MGVGNSREALRGRLVGNLVAYLLVAVIVLQISVPLGLVVLLVAPLLVVVSTVQLRPLSAAQTPERTRAQAVDRKSVVLGKSVNCGWGGRVGGGR